MRLEENDWPAKQNLNRCLNTTPKRKRVKDLAGLRSHVQLLGLCFLVCVFLKRVICTIRIHETKQFGNMILLPGLMENVMKFLQPH